MHLPLVLPRLSRPWAGEGSERARLERLATGLPVTFTGFRDDAKDWFQAIDLFVSASRSEPFGRVIIEALDAEQHEANGALPPHKK